jgi:hypothetical protein
MDDLLETLIRECGIPRDLLAEQLYNLAVHCHQSAADYDSPGDEQFSAAMARMPLFLERLSELIGCVTSPSPLP